METQSILSVVLGLTYVTTVFLLATIIVDWLIGRRP